MHLLLLSQICFKGDCQVSDFTGGLRICLLICCQDLSQVPPHVLLIPPLSTLRGRIVPRDPRPTLSLPQVRLDLLKLAFRAAQAPLLTLLHLNISPHCSYLMLRSAGVLSTTQVRTDLHRFC